MVESRLRRLHKTHKAPLSDDKDLTDYGHLTEKLKDKLRNIYGIALRQNVD